MTLALGIDEQDTSTYNSGLKSELQKLRDLHGVQRRAFQQLIARNPKPETVFQCAIEAQPADLTIVFPRGRERSGIAVGKRLVDQVESRRFRQSRPGCFQRNRALELRTYRDRMRPINRHSHTGN